MFGIQIDIRICPNFSSFSEEAGTRKNVKIAKNATKTRGADCEKCAKIVKMRKNDQNKRSRLSKMRKKVKNAKNATKIRGADCEKCAKITKFHDFFINKK